MLQKNIITGLLFLVGIFYNSITMGMGALIGVLSGTIAAFLLNYKKQDISFGIYGFNGVLIGVALTFFFEFSVLLMSLIILGSILSTLIMNFMHKRNLHPYTFPFVISTWILMGIINYFSLVVEQTRPVLEAVSLDIVSSLSMGFGQVMFQQNLATGIIFFVAILVSSRRAGLHAFLGSAIGMLASLLLAFPLNLVNIGIFGFNGVLCGLAFSDKKTSSFVYTPVATVISVAFIYGMINFNIPPLTAPFVFATWITLGLRKILF